MNLLLKTHLEDHGELFKQYMENETTDKSILAWLIKRLFIKLFRKQYMEYVFKKINIESWPDFEIKLAEKLGDDLASEIIIAIEQHCNKKKKK